MIISMADILKDAKKRGYGVAAPNVFDSITVKACFEAADALKAPVILDCAGLPFLEETACITKFYERKYPHVPVALNLDHGSSYEEIVSAIRFGFSSVMIDRSTLPYKENVREVSEIVKIAHALGVCVEAELGHVGQGFEYDETRDAGLTIPEEAVQYVRETEVDCLAVAVGTSHGAYKGTPHLDFQLLNELHQKISVPLVLHGGSGTGDDNLKKAVEFGIQKVNLFTDLSNAGLKSLLAYVGIDWDNMKQDGSKGEFANMKANLCDAGLEARKGYRELLMHYISLFGGAGRA
jgi:fructose-bisphosphate aldolase class II